MRRFTLLFAALAMTAGCGTTRSTDTGRSATEMLLVSDAVDKAVDQLSFAPLAGQKVFLDPQYLDATVDKGYLISAMRDKLVRHRALLQGKVDDATYVVELRSGGVGTDRSELLVGVPQMNLPAVVPGQPSFIPEIPIIKKTDQIGVAKIAVFIYHRETGQAIWQSGVKEGGSSAKDFWVFGGGPFRRGTVKSDSPVADVGVGINDINPFSGDEELTDERMSVTASSTWRFPDQQPPETRIASEQGGEKKPGLPPVPEIVPVSVIAK